jgi:hypothetical protein
MWLLNTRLTINLSLIRPMTDRKRSLFLAVRVIEHCTTTRDFSSAKFSHSSDGKTLWGFGSPQRAFCWEHPDLDHTRKRPKNQRHRLLLPECQRPCPTSFLPCQSCLLGTPSFGFVPYFCTSTAKSRLDHSRPSKALKSDLINWLPVTPTNSKSVTYKPTYCTEKPIAHRGV